MVESRWGSGFIVKASHFSVCLKFFMIRGLENLSCVKMQNSTYTEPAHLRHGGLAMFSMSKSSPRTDQGTSLLRLEEILLKAPNTKPDDWGVCSSSGPAAVWPQGTANSKTPTSRVPPLESIKAALLKTIPSQQVPVRHQSRQSCQLWLSSPSPQPRLAIRRALLHSAGPAEEPADPVTSLNAFGSWVTCQVPLWVQTRAETRLWEDGRQSPPTAPATAPRGWPQVWRSAF